jgi:hypothetical protein
MRRYLSIIPFLVALAGCGGTMPKWNAAAADRTTTSLARRPVLVRPDRRKTWISPELAAAKTELLFVSDSGAGDVYIYKVPSLKVVATITGFFQPQGECSDGKGNVWVTDTGGQMVYKLSHHGQLISEISDTSNPAACAWDPTTGNLAVMNIFDSASRSGGVLVYPKGTRAPTLYQNPDMYYYNFGGYDSSGNLYFDGRDADGNFILSELPKGAMSPHTVTLTGGTIYFPGMVQFSGKSTLIVGDQSCGNAYASCLYSVKISKNGGTIGAQLNLQTDAGGQVCDLVQGVVFGARLAGSDFNFCGSSSSATYLWPYPGGGKPSNHNASVVLAPIGAAISK